MSERYLENVRFLVVDDNMFIRTTVRLVLKTLGARDVKEASNGAEALKELETFAPDIIILDWEMEPVNGIELVERIRTAQDTPLAFVPLIMLTGHSEVDRVNSARDAGVNEFVVKPFSAHGLFTRIQAVIERPRSFVKVEGYFGPDRRRKDVPIDGEDRRKPKETGPIGIRQDQDDRPAADAGGSTG
ncbi:MAG: response regulator [Rhodospirillales bacterium]|nr:response regulator [Rhodospirillales bacterium]